MIGVVAVAEQIGVSADPEVATGTLCGDKTPFVVIASDGVFEFMPNQAVVQLVRPYLSCVCVSSSRKGLCN